LITALLATAGIFLQLQAEFLFIVQIILYVGGIMVLFVFVIMLVNLDVALHQLRFRRQAWIASADRAGSGRCILRLRFTSGRSGLPLPSSAAPASVLQPNTELVARSLFSSYMLPFEIASVLLLVAMIGAVVMAKRKV
jgi:NADH-quinone oxidoreductase subunit J